MDNKQALHSTLDDVITKTRALALQDLKTARSKLDDAIARLEQGVHFSKVPIRKAISCCGEALASVGEMESLQWANEEVKRAL